MIEKHCPHYWPFVYGIHRSSVVVSLFHLNKKLTNSSELTVISDDMTFIWRHRNQMSIRCTQRHLWVQLTVSRVRAINDKKHPQKSNIINSIDEISPPLHRIDLELIKNICVAKPVAVLLPTKIYMIWISCQILYVPNLVAYFGTLSREHSLWWRPPHVGTMR